MTIQTDLKGPVQVVTINRPEAMNALDVGAMSELRHSLCAARDNTDVRAIILTGYGGNAFCTGADLKKTAPSEHSVAEGYFATDEDAIELGLYLRGLAISDFHLGKPLIAAIDGYCLGGGMEIALACDMRVASENSTFGLTEPRWATVPAVGGISRLLRAVPRAVAMRWLLTGEMVDAAEAYRVGLISDLVSPGQTVERALEIASLITANGPLAVRSILEMTERADNLPLHQSVAFEQLLWGIQRDTDDRIEGRRAFIEKRLPRYSGS